MIFFLNMEGNRKNMEETKHKYGGKKKCVRNPPKSRRKTKHVDPGGYLKYSTSQVRLKRGREI